jgi:hypothetical protein
MRIVFLFLFGVSFALNDRIAIIMPKNHPTAFIGSERTIPFRPTEKQVEEVEAQLKKHLQLKHPALAKKYENYFRQYTGFTVGKAHRIRGNFMCREQKNWKTDWSLALDGGDCFFNFTFDVEANQITELDINGRA